ncbi:MAG TPA: winged helix-turn-helix domain-containing protein [Dyella sp.]|uniref:ArsR/SmtB family transcription factor n=1 Tax=Dyella sp. TaxID=1869338 RepID=UPI002F947EDE
MTEHRAATSADDPETRLAWVASAIAEPARSRMLCSLLDGHARTATELAAVAGVGAPTASAHLQRMKERGLLRLFEQGRHRYYQLAGTEVAQALEALLVVAAPAQPFTPSTPPSLRLARTCYDHLAGELGVAWHDRLVALGWLGVTANGADYLLTFTGKEALLAQGMAEEHSHRRRYAYPCMDWSMRRPHLGGALGAALLELCLRRGWLRRQLDSRALILTPKGKRDFEAIFGMGARKIEAPQPQGRVVADNMVRALN